VLNEADDDASRLATVKDLVAFLTRDLARSGVSYEYTREDDAATEKARNRLFEETTGVNKNISNLIDTMMFAFVTFAFMAISTYIVIFVYYRNMISNNEVYFIFIGSFAEFIICFMCISWIIGLGIYRVKNNDF